MDPNLLLIFAVAGACFGFLVGYILRGLFRQSEKSDENSVAENEADVLAVTQKEPPEQNWKEAASLWRDRDNGSFILQVGKKFYRPGDEVSAKERNALLKIFRDFYFWLEPNGTVSQSGSVPSDKMSAVIDDQPSVSLRVDTAPPGGSNGNSSKVSVNPANLISNALRADVPGASTPTQTNMVAQVDEILQAKLIQANMQKWAIRLAEFPGKGMVVLVGLEQYEGIDEVPYERVRKIIRESVREWERRMDALLAKQEAQQLQF
jgi:hypothetical protein